MNKLPILIIVLSVTFNSLSQNNIRKISDIKTPEGFTRNEYISGSYESFLSNLLLKNDKTVYLYNGTKKYNQTAQWEVIDLKIGNKDLHQCADAVMRLRGEYLFTTKQYDKIHFNFLSDGKARYYKDYCKGDYSYPKFWKYMEYIFSYANTASLKKELLQVSNFKDIKIGDVLIQSGTPYGHAVIVIDMCYNAKGEKAYLLAQSYMPAQEIHILKNPNSNNSPWYFIEDSDKIETPEWNFIKSDLRRFK